METFGTAEDGDLVAVPDSHWRLSLAVNRGNAARALLLSVGDEVRPQAFGGDGLTIDLQHPRS